MAESITNKLTIDNNIDDKLNKLSFTQEIKDFYKNISSSAQEIYINNWTLFSVDKILEMTEKYKKDNIPYIDIGFRYIGMGHVDVAFFHPKYNTILFRPDGGSSGHDRIANYNNLKQANPTKFENGITFARFIEIIKHGEQIDKHYI